jgi:hypothetical protein
MARSPIPDPRIFSGRVPLILIEVTTEPKVERAEHIRVAARLLDGNGGTEADLALTVVGTGAAKEFQANRHTDADPLSVQRDYEEAVRRYSKRTGNGFPPTSTRVESHIVGRGH